MCMLTLPGAIITCTSTGTASMPWNATVRTRATMFLPPDMGSPEAHAIMPRTASSETTTDFGQRQEQLREQSNVVH